MDEGDGGALMDADFPEDTLPEKPANVVQVCGEERGKLLIQNFKSSLRICRRLSAKCSCMRKVFVRVVIKPANFAHKLKYLGTIRVTHLHQ